jgi:methylglyoxal synthase
MRPLPIGAPRSSIGGLGRVVREGAVRMVIAFADPIEPRGESPDVAAGSDIAAAGTGIAFM